MPDRPASAAVPNHADVIRHSALQARMVLDYDTTETVGTVDTLLVDVKQGRVEGLVCKTGLMGRHQERLAWSQLENIGTDGLVARLQPGTNREQLAAAQSCVGLEVWTDAGNKVGHIVDCQFSCKDGEIIWYLFSVDELLEREHGLYGLKPNDILSAGRKRIMVAAAVIEQAELKAEGLPQTSTTAAQSMWADPEQPQQNWSSLVQEVKLLGQKVQQGVQEIKNYTQEHFPEMTGQLQDQTQQAGNTVQKRVEDIRDRFQKRSPSADYDTIDTIDLDAFEVWEDD